MSSRVLIQQIYYRPEQVERLDPAFVPYDNTPGHWLREYSVMRKQIDSVRWDEVDLLGFVSWKWGDKTHVAGRDWIAYIQAHPGYDVYLLNPAPHRAWFFKNVWDEAEEHHPGLTRIATKLLAGAGVPQPPETWVADPDRMVLANFWAGNRAFWTRFIEVVDRVLAQVPDLPEDERQMMQSDADRNRPDCNYIPFLIERIVPALLSAEPAWRSCAWAWTDEALAAHFGAGPARQILEGRRAREEFTANAISEATWEAREQRIRRRFVDAAIRHGVPYGLGFAVAWARGLMRIPLVAAALRPLWLPLRRRAFPWS